MRKWFFIALVAALVVGCKSTETQSPAPIDEQGAATAAGAAGTGAATSGAAGAGVQGTQAGSGAMSPLKDPNNILSKRSVYFDFDSFVVKDEFRPLIQAHARYLQSHPNAKMTLQGNTDERGSREYNIALGQKRADAVKQLMQVLGATDAQIETVSFGKEKPKAEGHDETAWAQNRRVDVVYSGE